MRSFADYRKRQLWSKVYSVSVKEAIENITDVLEIDIVESVRLPEILVENNFAFNTVFNKTIEEDYRENLRHIRPLVHSFRKHFYPVMLESVAAKIGPEPDIDTILAELIGHVDEMIEALKREILSVLSATRAEVPESPEDAEIAAAAGEADLEPSLGDGAPAIAGRVGSRGHSSVTSSDLAATMPSSSASHGSSSRITPDPLSSTANDTGGLGTNPKPSDGIWNGIKRLGGAMVPGAVRDVWFNRKLGSSPRPFWMKKEDVEYAEQLFLENAEVISRVINDFRDELVDYIRNRIVTIANHSIKRPRPSLRVVGGASDVASPETPGAGIGAEKTGLKPFSGSDLDPTDVNPDEPDLGAGAGPTGPVGPGDLGGDLGGGAGTMPMPSRIDEPTTGKTAAHRQIAKQATDSSVVTTPETSSVVHDAIKGDPVSQEVLKQTYANLNVALQSLGITTNFKVSDKNWMSKIKAGTLTVDNKPIANFLTTLGGNPKVTKWIAEKCYEKLTRQPVPEDLKGYDKASAKLTGVAKRNKKLGLTLSHLLGGFKTNPNNSLSFTVELLLKTGAKLAAEGAGKAIAAAEAHPGQYDYALPSNFGMFGTQDAFGDLADLGQKRTKGPRLAKPAKPAVVNDLGQGTAQNVDDELGRSPDDEVVQGATDLGAPINDKIPDASGSQTMGTPSGKLIDILSQDPSWPMIKAKYGGDLESDIDAIQQKKIPAERAISWLKKQAGIPLGNAHAEETDDDGGVGASASLATPEMKPEVVPPEMKAPTDNPLANVANQPSLGADSQQTDQEEEEVAKEVLKMAHQQLGSEMVAKITGGKTDDAAIDALVAAMSGAKDGAKEEPVAHKTNYNIDEDKLRKLVQANVHNLGGNPEVAYEQVKNWIKTGIDNVQDEPQIGDFKNKFKGMNLSAAGEAYADKMFKDHKLGNWRSYVKSSPSTGTDIKPNDVGPDASAAPTGPSNIGGGTGSLLKHPAGSNAAPESKQPVPFTQVNSPKRIRKGKATNPEEVVAKVPSVFSDKPSSGEQERIARELKVAQDRVDRQNQVPVEKPASPPVKAGDLDRNKFDAFAKANKIGPDYKDKLEELLGRAKAPGGESLAGLLDKEFGSKGADWRSMYHALPPEAVDPKAEKGKGGKVKPVRPQAVPSSEPAQTTTPLNKKEQKAADAAIKAELAKHAEIIRKFGKGASPADQEAMVASAVGDLNRQVQDALSKGDARQALEIARKANKEWNFESEEAEETKQAKPVKQKKPRKKKLEEGFDNIFNNFKRILVETKLRPNSLNNKQMLLFS